jgi:hypothetical protein
MPKVLVVGEAAATAAAQKDAQKEKIVLTA